jgi:hypothetical protein
VLQRNEKTHFGFESRSRLVALCGFAFDRFLEERNFIFECGFGGIRNSAPMRRFAADVSSEDLGTMSSVPRTFQFKVSAEQMGVATGELFHYFGLFMTRWAQLETTLYYWFGRVTTMPEGMSRAIFYGARGFAARAEMLEAAIEHATVLKPEETAVLKEGVKKARQYSTFRNKVAHGEPRLNVKDLNNPQIHYTITQGKNTPNEKEEVITLEHLTAAASNIHTLVDCIRDTLPPLRTAKQNPKSPEECLAIIRSLPNEAQSKSDQTDAASAPQPKEPQHRNKKEYRAAQAEKKKPPEDEK